MLPEIDNPGGRALLVLSISPHNSSFCLAQGREDNEPAMVSLQDISWVPFRVAVATFSSHTIMHSHLTIADGVTLAM